MSETTKEPVKEVVKGDGENFVKKAAAADKKPVAKKPSGKKPAKTGTKKPADKKAAEGEKPIVKKPLSRAQIAERKYGVESTWRPFEVWAREKGLVKDEPAKKEPKTEEKK